MGWFSRKPADKPDLSGLGRNTLGCHTIGCPCATDPRHHWPEYLETAEQKAERERRETERTIALTESWRFP